MKSITSSFSSLKLMKSLVTSLVLITPVAISGALALSKSDSSLSFSSRDQAVISWGILLPVFSLLNFFLVWRVGDERPPNGKMFYPYLVLMFTVMASWIMGIVVFAQEVETGKKFAVNHLVMGMILGALFVADMVARLCFPSFVRAFIRYAINVVSCVEIWFGFEMAEPIQGWKIAYVVLAMVVTRM